MPEKSGRGMALILAAVLVFACLDSTAKYLSGFYPLVLLVWARYTAQFLLMVAFLAPSHGRALLHTHRPGAQILRALLLLGVTVCVITALSLLPLAEATALGYTSPLMAALLAGPLLGERVGTRRWLALAAGFCGVLLIAHPGGALTGPGVLWALLGALCYACYQLMTRHLHKTENSLTLLFYTALVGTLVSSIALPWLPHHPLPQGLDWLPVVSMGVLGGLGHFLLIRAFRHADVATLAPMLYSQLLWAAGLGWLIFGHLPDSWAISGMFLVVVSGLAVALPKPRPTGC